MSFKEEPHLAMPSGEGINSGPIKHWDEDDGWVIKPSTVTQENKTEYDIGDEEAKENSIEARKLIRRLVGRRTVTKKAKSKPKPKTKSNPKKAKGKRKGNR